MDKWMIEYYHNKGQMPDWVYYQLNGKSAEENLAEQHEKIYARLREQQLARQREKELEKEIEREIDKKLGVALEKALDDLLDGFNRK